MKRTKKEKLLEQNPFDYYDFCNHELFKAEVMTRIIEGESDLSPSTIQTLLILTQISIDSVKIMLRIPDKELKKYSLKNRMK